MSASEVYALDLNSLDEEVGGPKDGLPRHSSMIVSNPVEKGQESSEGKEGMVNWDNELTLREQLHAVAEELQRKKRETEGSREEDGLEMSREVWGKLRGVTGGLAQRLCEQLRLVLEPMVATKLQGDYRSGKRINMRRVIPYIASGFRKDKIWLRRTKPAKRDYQVTTNYSSVERTIR